MNQQKFSEDSEGVVYEETRIVDQQTEAFLAAKGDDAPCPCSCTELREHLYEFLDSELADSECERLRRHMTDCPECLEAADAEAHIRELLRNACHEQAPQGLRARVVAQLTVLRTTSIRVQG